MGSQSGKWDNGMICVRKGGGGGDWGRFRALAGLGDEGVTATEFAVWLRVSGTGRWVTFAKSSSSQYRSSIFSSLWLWSRWVIELVAVNAVIVEDVVVVVAVHHIVGISVGHMQELVHWSLYAGRPMNPEPGYMLRSLGC